MMIMFFSYGLALWYGATLIANGTVNPSTGNVFTGGDVVSVFFAVLMGSFAIGQAGAFWGRCFCDKRASFIFSHLLRRYERCFWTDA
jgi:hypothetical protein